ncbi:hypothetical protein PMIN06_012490 [Paraphaeosphaeria minitans]|uniref:Uncharacterized protein n=1 Tax=Paraphaeosphaeria minitans TaxID=565426 RepID=A0A9P6G6H2_9PLEO|nr:hypothetical protein PMIN01_11944 [Paraphaeosphaeria minitans]
MALTEFSLEEALESVLEEGFFDFNTPEVGELVSEMERERFQFLSPYGLDYCKEHVLENTRIRPIIEKLLNECKFAHWIRYNARPGHFECFRKGGEKAGLRQLIVQQWAKGSRVEYYGGSHKHDLPVEEGVRGLFETTQAALNAAGCQPTEKEFPAGGLVIHDGRTFTQIKTGYGITFQFATDDVIQKWPKITVPNSTDLVRKVVNMESAKIKVNFAIGNAGGAKK